MTHSDTARLAGRQIGPVTFSTGEPLSAQIGDHHVQVSVDEPALWHLSTQIGVSWPSAGSTDGRRQVVRRQLAAIEQTEPGLVSLEAIDDSSVMVQLWIEPASAVALATQVQAMTRIAASVERALLSAQLLLETSDELQAGPAVSPDQWSTQPPPVASPPASWPPPPPHAPPPPPGPGVTRM